MCMPDFPDKSHFNLIPNIPMSFFLADGRCKTYLAESSCFASLTDLPSLRWGGEDSEICYVQRLGLTFLIFVIKHLIRHKLKERRSIWMHNVETTVHCVREGVATRDCSHLSGSGSREDGNTSTPLLIQSGTPSYGLVPPIFRGSLPTQLILSGNALPDISKGVLH